MKTLEITSPTNAQFKILKSLLTSKGIKEHHQFILSGQKLIEEFLAQPSPEFKIDYVLFADELKIKTDAKLTRLSKDLFAELDVLGTHFNLVVLSFKEFEKIDLQQAPQGLELICPLGDPNNLGALMRTALGFGISRLVLTAEATHPFLPKALKASAGSALKLRLSKVSLRLNEIPMVHVNYALELHGTSLQQIRWPKDLRLWVGEEGPGLNLTQEQKHAMKFVNIPTENIESLNANVSTSLALWEWKKQNSI